MGSLPQITQEREANPDAPGGGVREQLALCSYKLVFDHPATGERMTFELP